MDELPSNSYKKQTPKQAPEDAQTDEKKPVEKIVQGEVVQRKKSMGKRFRETFTGESNQSVFDYMVFDILLPAARDTFVDVATAGIERKFYGESRPPSRRGGRRDSSPLGHVAYNRMSSRDDYRGRRDDPRDNRLSRRARANHDFGEIVLETRVEAEEVIDRLFSLVSQFEVATVADLYDLLGVTGAPIDNKWGWTDLRGARVDRVRRGYLLDLPPTEPLD